MTYGPDGKLALLYREETENNRDIYIALQGVDGKWARQRVSQTGWQITGCPMTYFSVTPLRDGYLAAWPTKGEIDWAKLDADGKVLAPGEIKTVGRNGMRTGLTAVEGAGGTVLINWNDGSRLGWQIFGSDGKQIGETGASDTKGKGAAAVAAADGSFIVFP